MSDPNQPYGAIPPPPFPPPGPPPTGPLGGPPGGPPFPPPPAPPGASGKGNALWIALAVIGVLALAGVVTALVLLLTGDDEDDPAGIDDGTSSAVATSSSTPATEGGSPTTPTDPTADSPTDPTLTVGPTDPDPSDPATTPGQPRGTSTADQVANEPAAVVEAFIESVFAGDCATAEDLVTREYLQAEGGGCDPGDVPSDLKDQVDYSVGKATVNDAAGTATVPVTISAYGESDKTVIELQKVGGRWLISGDGED